MKHLVRFILTAVTGVVTMLTLSSTAHAVTEPVRPGSGSVPLPGIDHQSTVRTAVESSAGWGPSTLVGALVLVALVVGIAIALNRQSRRRRRTQRPAYGV